MLEFWIKPFFSVLIWIILQHECCRLVTLKYGPVAALDIFMMFTSGCSIFTTDAVYYYVTTRWVIVLILLQRLKNAFRHVQSIRNKSPLGQHRGFFFFISNFQNNMFLMKCSRSTNSLKDWWPLKPLKYSQWEWLLHEIPTVLENDFFRSHEKKLCCKK